MDEDLWSILIALENNTRREMLKTLANYDSYGLELSKMIGVSQQAINKQLEILEKLGLISTNGSMPSTMGPPRKVYRSMGFSTITIDYSRNFMSIKKMDIEYDNDNVEGNNSDLVHELDVLNHEINEIDSIKNAVEKSVGNDCDILKNLHALLVYLGKDHCRTKPLCRDCPVNSICNYYATAHP